MRSLPKSTRIMFTPSSDNQVDYSSLLTGCRLPFFTCFHIQIILSSVQVGTPKPVGSDTSLTDKLERYCTMFNLQREIETLSLVIKPFTHPSIFHFKISCQAIRNLHTEFSSTDNGIHLLDVQEKLHKFQLQEIQVGISIWIENGFVPHLGQI